MVSRIFLQNNTHYTPLVIMREAIAFYTVNKNTGLHNPYSPLLFGEVMPEDKIIERKMVSLKNNQLNLF